MELKFLGRGSAFNPKEGNTSAYFIEDNELFLIDCGSTVFWKIIRMNLLENIEKINVFITHTHTDHIGSLGTLIEYTYFAMNKKVNLILEEGTKHIENIRNILSFSGINREMYNIVYTKKVTSKYKTFYQPLYIETSHVENLNTYSLVFLTKEGIVFYSGDINNISYLEYLLSINTNIDKIYIETTLNDSNPVHLPLNELIRVIPKYLKDKVYCMHLESNECIQKVLENGLNVVEVEKSPTKKLIK